jgi:hypothetical protein
MAERCEIHDAINDEVVRLALGNIRSVLIEPQWLPISSAPKDGTPILLFAEGKIGIGYIEQRARSERLIGHASWIGREKWADGDTHTEVTLGWVRPADATHWMPLPKPPATI